MPRTIQQVLVHLDPTLSAPLRLSVARAIAQQHGAELTGLYATVPIYGELPYVGEMGPTVLGSLMEIDEQRRQATHRIFHEAARAGELAAYWCQVSDVPVIEAVAQQSFHADLLVLGQPDESDAASGSVPRDFVASVLLASGKAAIVVPHVGWPGVIGENVAIAWKETREAARAVAAALPLLQRTRHVHVLTWGESPPSGVQGRALNLDRYLRSHGVEPTWHRSNEEPDELGEMMLSRAFDLGADLLVMGCYGHSRAREWIQGGTTRTVLSSMTLPVLMAH